VFAASAAHRFIAVVLLWLCLPGLALAWDAAEGPTLQLPERPHAMVAADLRGNKVLVATSPKGTWVVQPRTGEILYASPTGGTSVMVRADSDGFPQLLTCGPFGIHALALDVSGFARALPLSDRRVGALPPSCRAAEARPSTSPRRAPGPRPGCSRAMSSSWWAR
jgi:hypothetical protein